MTSCTGDLMYWCIRYEEREPIFSKGQSKRLWNELYKVGYPPLPWLLYIIQVIDSSDVVIQVRGVERVWQCL